jgi:hypothetical protein
VLAKSTRNLNSRIRHTGCSSRELWVKRDQDSGQSLTFEDKQISDAQYEMRIKSHESSAKYESRNAHKVALPEVKIGDRIYIKSDGSKSKARDPYIILSFVPNKNEVEVQKLLDRNRRNVIRVQLQNIYKVIPDDDNSDDSEGIEDAVNSDVSDQIAEPKQEEKDDKVDQPKDLETNAQLEEPKHTNAADFVPPRTL